MKQLRNEQGYALAIAVLVITVLSILGISLMATTGNSKKMANKEQENQAAYYIAEAGMNLKKAEIKKAADQFRKDTAGWKDSKLDEALKQPPKINLSTTYNSKNSNGTDKVFDTNNASAKVTVEYTTKPGAKTTTDNQTKAVQNYIYKIKSVGMIDNQKRTITSTMSYDLTVNSEEQAKPDEEIEGYYPIEGIPEASIHALESFKYNQASLSGPLFFGFDSLNLKNDFPFTNGNQGGKFSYFSKPDLLNFKNQPTCLNENCLKTGIENNSLQFNVKDLVKLYPFPTKKFEILKNKIEFPSKPANIKSVSSGILTEGVYKVNKSEENLSFDIGNSDVTLFLDHPKFSGNITVKGSGNLTLVANSIDINSGIKVSFKADHLSIFSNKFSVSNGASLNVTSDLLKINTIDFNSSSTSSFISKDIFLNADSISFSSGEHLNITSTSLNMRANKNFTFNKSNQNIAVSKINIISNSVDFDSYTTIGAENSFTIYANEFLKINTSFNKQKPNVFYAGTNEVSLGWIDINANFDFLKGYINQFNVSKFLGNAIFRNTNPSNNKIFINNYEKSLATNFFYMPGFNVEINSSKELKGVLVAKSVDIVNGKVEYAKPDLTTTNPPTPGNGGNNGSNNGDSIIIDSSFSDAIDSGTVEIDNDR